MSKDSAADISQAVVENGLDFLERAVAEMAANPADNKWPAIHLYGAIEVLIKARLIREHWTLACDNVDGRNTKRPTLTGFKNGDVKTVDGLQGLDRLTSTVGLTISQKQRDSVDKVRQLRNRVAHFAVVGSEPDPAIRVQLGRGLDFVIWFLEEHFLPSSPDGELFFIEEALPGIRAVLKQIEVFVAGRLDRLKPELDEAELLVGCPDCAQGTVTITKSELRCLFCSWSPIPGEEAEEAADLYVGEVLGLSSYVVIKDGGEWPVKSCPECEVDALVEGVEFLKGPAPAMVKTEGLEEYPYPLPELLCFNCGFQSSYTALGRCGRCDSWITDPDLSICSDCADYVRGRD